MSDYSNSKIWYEDYEGKDWIQKNVIGSDWIKNNYNIELYGIYQVKINEEIAYVGESKEMGTRFVTHAYTLAKKTKDHWGLFLEQIENDTVKIIMEPLELEIPEEKLNDKEKEYLNMHKGSLLQRHNGTDGKPSQYCTDTKGKRVEYIQSALNLK